MNNLIIMSSSKKIISISPQKRIKVSGGDVLHVLKSTDSEYRQFNEAYFSFIESGRIKAWKRHLEMTMNIVVPIGMVEFVFYDSNESFICKEIIGENQYSRLTVPPKIWFGFKCVSKKDALILNISNILHSVNEVERKDISSFECDVVL